MNHPPPFMRMFRTGVACCVDPWMPASGLFLIQMPPAHVPHPVFGTGTPVLFGSPSAWAEFGAHNLANAYRPEGIA